MPRRLILGLVVAGLVAACSSSTVKQPRTTPSPAASAGRGIVVAAFNFTESQILANVFADVLTDAGVPASVRTLTTREVVEPALWSGSVQVVPEYTASLAAFLDAGEQTAGATAAPKDPTATLAALRKNAPKHDFVVLNASTAADQNAFAVTKQFAAANKVKSLSDLSRYTGPLALGGPPECKTRPYCLAGLEQTYGIRFTRFLALDPGGPLTKLALKTGQVQLGLVFSSDPGIEAYNLTVLDDDKHLQDVDVVVPVVHKDAATPTVMDTLNALMARLTTADLRQLNSDVDLRHNDPSTVARAFVDRLKM